MPKWKSARAEVAGRMAKTVWPELDNRTWTPPVELADELLARSDYRKAVASWREIGELSHLASAAKGRPIMEEASKKADEHVALAFELARSAIAAQNRIVERVQGGVLEAARSKKQSLLSKAPVLSDIVAMLTSKTLEMWEESRLATLWPDGKVPENADEQHVELYPSVKRKIELVARKILEEINIPEPNDAKEKREDPKDDPEEDEPLMEFTISVQNTSSGVEVKLLKGNTPVVERSVDRKFRQFDEAMREVSRRLGKDLLALP